MASRLIGRLLVYPIILLCGMAIGSDYQPGRAPLAPSGPYPDDEDSPHTLPGRGRTGAESAELRALRVAEREMFPELNGLDPDAALVSQWDEPSDISTNPNDRPNHLSLAEPAHDFMKQLKKPDIPVRRHPRVLKYVNYFSKSAKGRKLFTAWLKRSGHYRPIIEDELRARGLPLDLQAVVYIESGFWPTARSKAGAVGLWQFMPRTARAYGLVVDGNYDERRSIWRSTEAAAQHLEDLHEHMRSWDLALAAYNYGHENVLRRMRELGARDFWELSAIDDGLPKETVLYVPKVLAVAVILRNLEYFGFSDIEQADPFEAVAIKVPPGIRMSLIARAAGTSLRKMRDLNPHIRNDTIPDRGGPMVIHIPRSGHNRARIMLPKLLQENDEGGLDQAASIDFDWGRDEFGQDGLSPMDRLHKTTKAGARGTPSLSPLSANTSVGGSAGGRTSVPSAAADSLLAAAPSTNELVTAVKNGVAPVTIDPSGPEWRALRELPRARVVHQVQPGETVWEIAEAYCVSRGHIIRTNSLKNPDVLTVGRRLVLHVPVPEAKKK